MTVVAADAGVSQVDAAAAAASTRPRCSTEDMLQLLQDYDCWVFDLDGTIWRGNEVIEGVLEALELLRKLGKKVLFMTNNSMKSRGSYLDKCLQVGLPAHVVTFQGSKLASPVAGADLYFATATFVQSEQPSNAIQHCLCFRSSRYAMLFDQPSDRVAAL